MIRSALIIAHGQPSEPGPPEAEMAALARAVAAHLPGWQIGSATLAAPDALRIALQSSDKPSIFPFFMADGWFIRSLLPRRLAEADEPDLPVLTPFGLLAETAALAVTVARDAAAAQGWTEAETTLVLAAHGSGRSPRPAASAHRIADVFAAESGFKTIRTGFIEQRPVLADAARGSGAKSLCLPLFVARWGHVVADIPAALAEAGFAGHLLDPLGVHPEVPAIIARAIGAA
ncbi:MAG: CbiX/SirB N-terminal domain-containing protein [Paracoccaceae bacterium]